MVPSTPNQRVRIAPKRGSEGNRSSFPTSRAQMKVRSSFFTLAFVSLMFVGLLLLGIPVSGFAQPHPCKADLSGHLPLSPNGLGGVPSFHFLFARDCTTPSGAITLKWFIYKYSNNALLCSGGPVDITQSSTPPYTVSVTCGSLPIGSGNQVKVVLSYQTAPGGSWMNHPDNYYNKQ